jgi:predicted nicotinamide N-methyase
VIATELTEETVVVGGREVHLVRPRDSEALLDEEAFEHEERLPYWAELWPSALALSDAVAVRALRGARTLELGCGLGLPSVAAALAGARVLATDWSDQALAFVKRNARRNGATVETGVCAWARAHAVVARGPWDLVLASDVLYERRNVEQLLDLLPRLVDERGEVWLADPGRPTSGGFLDAAAERFTRRTCERDGHGAQIELHRFRKRSART